MAAKQLATMFAYSVFFIKQIILDFTENPGMFDVQICCLLLFMFHFGLIHSNGKLGITTNNGTFTNTIFK